MSDIRKSSSRSRRSTPFYRQAWGHLFGGLLRDAREERGCSLENAAQAAGMEVTQWEAVEAGQVPENWEQVHRMADGLGIDRSWLIPLVLFCHEAWG
ncbi:helix-turn-helix transcriptional regulator [Telmatobacter sp. DSM 110680]|uniref:Helix-turn-helix transcriptional regulator n=1 Tax=Telmatobacter sp. DSM 110680 TaxID=3036704 RepID=A0AAU7DMQ9_9BACT